jgi:hypothetical protein
VSSIGSKLLRHPWELYQSLILRQEIYTEQEMSGQHCVQQPLSQETFGSFPAQSNHKSTREETLHISFGIVPERLFSSKPRSAIYA